MNKLKMLRLKYGYTCKQMADFLNISDTYYWQLENEKRRLTYQLAVEIASIFKMEPDQIFYTDFVKRLHNKNKSTF